MSTSSGGECPEKTTPEDDAVRGWLKVGSRASIYGNSKRKNGDQLMEWVK